MRSLGRLVEELLQNFAGQACDSVVDTDDWMFVFMAVAIVIWALSASYQILKGIHKAMIDAAWKYKYNKELKKVNKHPCPRKRPTTRVEL